MATDSQRQERRGAKVYDGKVNAGSGNTTGHKNDVRTADRSIEFKTTRAKSYALKLEDLILAERNALLDGREALFGLDFVTADRTFRYVIIPEWDYLELSNGRQAPG